MKKLFFSILTIVAFTLMSFTNDTKKDSEILMSEALQIEALNETSNDDTVRCRWRTCTYVNGELQGCSEWTYGNCDKDENGKLTPIRPTIQE